MTFIKSHFGTIKCPEGSLSASKFFLGAARQGKVKGRGAGAPTRGAGTPFYAHLDAAHGLHSLNNVVLSDITWSCQRFREVV